MAGTTFTFTTIDVGVGGTFPSAIDGSGQVVGWDISPNGLDWNSFIDSDGTIAAITVPNAQYTTPMAINDSGEVVGSYYTPGAAAGALCTAAALSPPFRFPAASTRSPTTSMRAG